MFTFNYQAVQLFQMETNGQLQLSLLILMVQILIVQDNKQV